MLSVSGISVDGIVRKTGTPLYLYDAGLMRRQYRRLKSALPSGVDVHFSIKANPNIAVAQVFRSLGAGAEVAASELGLALRAGFKPDKILFAGPGKSVDELKLAVRNRIESINIESATELDRVLEIAGRSRSGKGKPVGISFRVNIDFPSPAGGEIMIGGPRKFVVDNDTLLPLVQKAMSDGRVKVMGFHCFAGTQITDTKTLVAIYRHFAKWAKGFAKEANLRVRRLNFGGGLGIPFRDNEKELNVESLGKAMAGIRKDLAKSPYFKKTRFLIEPGRFLAGPSGIYISRVTDIKVSRGERYVITDGGIHHAIIPIVLNKNYPSAILNRMGERKTADLVVAGPLCASADQFSRRLRLPDPRIGDLIGLFNSGAYGYSAGMLYFLSHPTPAEAMVDGGKLYLIRRPKRPEHGLMKKINI